MALIFCDGFDHYVTGDTLKKWTSYDDSNWKINTSQQRTGRACTGDGYVADATKIFSNNYEKMIIGFAFKFPTYHDRDFIFIYDDAVLQTKLRLNSNGSISVYRNTTLLGISDVLCTINGSVYQYIEMETYIHSSLGRIIVRINEKVILDLENINTQNSSNSYVNKFKIERTGSTYIDDLYVDDSDFLGDIKVETIYPNSGGNYSGFIPLSGENFSNVNDITHNSDTSYVASRNVDSIDTYGMQDLSTIEGDIKGIQATIVARKSDAGSKSLALVSRLSDTDYVNEDLVLNDDYTFHTVLVNQNPDTGLDWTIEEFNNAEFGFKVIK